MGPSLGHHRGSRGGEEEEQTSGSESRTGGEATSVSESGSPGLHRASRGGDEEERRRSKPVGSSPWQPGRRGEGVNQWVRVRDRGRSNQCVRVRGITVAVREETRSSNQWVQV